MTEHAFTLVFRLADAGEDPQRHIERLAAAGCDDALVGVGTPGRIALAFDRRAASAEASRPTAATRRPRARSRATRARPMPPRCRRFACAPPCPKWTSTASAWKASPSSWTTQRPMPLGQPMPRSRSDEPRAR
jgi:hypothetical protein